MTTANQKAKQVLQALIEGVDPETGDELAKDTVLNRADVMRALLASVAAIDAMQARAMRRAQLPASVGKTWSDEEEQQLREEYRKQKMPVADIAAKHGRTVRAIEARLERMGLLRPDQRTTNNSFVSGPARKEEGPGGKS